MSVSQEGKIKMFKMYGGKGVSPLNPLEVILDGREGVARTVAVHLFANLSLEGAVIRDP